jgi:hypothetical protein
MNDAAVFAALNWCVTNKARVPADLIQKIEEKGISVPAALKSDEVTDAGADYHDTITELLTTYFENGGSITSPRNQFKQAMVEAFGTSFDTGWVDGGQELPADEDALDWLNARVEQEMGFIDMLFQEAKELRREEDFDYFSWITARADGYVRTLAEVYNQARLRASQDIMVTFDGDDGEESCPDCQKYKGARHKISWFVKRNAVPPFGTGLECHPGGRCKHGLFDDGGNKITI